MAWGVGALGLGIFLNNAVPAPGWLLGIVAALAALLAWAARTRCELIAWLFAFLAAGAIGALRFAALHQPLPPDHLASLPLPFKGTVIEGTIAGAPRVYPARGTTTVLLAVRTVKGPTLAAQPAQGLVRVTLHWTALELAYGDLIRIEGTLFAPSPPTNPGQSDYRTTLARRGIHALMSTWNPEDLSVQARRRGHPLKHRLLYLRRWATERLAASVGSPESEVLGSIVFGFRSGLSPELLESFRITGLMHILVASGMNVGLLAWLCLALFSALGLPRVRAAPLTLPILIAFLLLCGADPPLTRATLMFGLLVGAQALGRATAPLNALGAAAVLILLAEPLALWDRSFQFSYAATFGVMALAPWVVKRRGRLPRWVAEVVACTIAAQLALLPLLADTFATVPLLGALANFFVTPLMGLFLTGGLALLALGWIPLLGPALGAALKLSLAAVLTVVDAFARVPLASVVAPPFSVAALLAYVAWTSGGLLWLTAPRGPLWPKILCLTGAFGMASLLWRAALTPAPRELAITFLDVGQGLAAVIRLPSGRTILWDAGRPFAGSAVVAPFLKSFGIGRLAAVVLTHPHHDHVGGMPTVLRQLPTDTVLLTGHGFNRTKMFTELRRLLLAGHAPCRLLFDGVELTGEPGVRLLFLHPPRGWFQDAPHAQLKDENSAVLAIEYKNTAALLTGDIKARSERRLQSRLDTLPPARLLQVPHHGSVYGSTREFLAAVRPQHAVVSAGANNRFGHPHPAIVIRYRDQGARLWQTARTGAIVATSDGHHWSVAASATKGGN